MQNCLLSAAGCLLALSVTLPAKDLIPLFPEATVAAISVRHADKWAGFSEHPVAMAVEAGGLKDLIAEIGEQLTGSDDLKNFEKDSGITLEALRAKFSGEATIALTEFELAKDDPTDAPLFELAAAIEYSGDATTLAAVLKTMAADPEPPAAPDGDAQSDDEEEEEDGEEEEMDEPDSLQLLLEAKAEVKTHEGVEMHIHAPEATKDEGVEALAWCVRDGVLLMATGEEPLRDMIDRAAGKAQGKSFSDSKTWQTAVAQAGDADFMVAADIGYLMTSMLTAIDAEEGKGNGSAQSSADMLKMIGLDKLEVFALGITIEKDSLMQSLYASCSTMPPLLKAFGGSGNVDAPDFLPAAIDGASWAGMNLGSVVQESLKLLGSMAGGRNPLESMAKAAGVNLDILDQLGNGYFQVTRQFGEITFDDLVEAPELNNLIDIVVPAKEGAVMGLKLKDPKLVETSLRSLLKLALFIKVDAREYMDFKLHMNEAKAPGREAPKQEQEEEDEEYEGPEPPQWALTVADDWLLISVGRIELLESILSGIRKKPEQPFWMRPDVKQGMGALPSGETYRSVQNLDPAARTIVMGMVSMASMTPGMEFLAEADPGDYLKGLRCPLLSFEKWYIESGAVRSAGRISVAPKSE